MANLATATSRMSNMSEDQAKESYKDMSAKLDAADSTLKQAKDKSSASLHKQKTEASAYATSARVGQITITGGNLAALIALYKQTSDSSGANRFANAVQGLILTSIAISGVLLVLQVLLANVAPMKNNTGVYWQLMNAYHHRLQLMFFWLCCCFGSRPRHDHDDAQLSGSSSYHPVNTKDPESLTGEQAVAHANGNAKGGVDSAATLPDAKLSSNPPVSDVENPVTNGNHGPVQATAHGDSGRDSTAVDEGVLFESWQQDMNTTITLLGSVLTVLNAVIAGLTGSGGAPGAAASPAGR